MKPNPIEQEAAKPVEIKQAIRSLQDAAWNCGTDEYRDGVSDNAASQRYNKMVQARSNCGSAADVLLERVRLLEEALWAQMIRKHPDDGEPCWCYKPSAVNGPHASSCITARAALKGSQ